MHEYKSGLPDMLRSIWLNWSLIKTSAKREVIGRYRGSFLGLMWSFFNPLLMLAVYTFVFSAVFKARWGTGSDSKTEFALVLFAGLIVFSIFSDCVNRAPGLILNNPNYVKKVVFPLEILPFVSLLSAFYHASISLAVWFVAYLFLEGSPHATVLYLPLIFIPYGFFIMGITWGLASLGVFLRDVSQFVSVITPVMMFMSPIFYPVSILPEAYRALLYLNPLTTVIETVRDVIYWGKHPDLSTLILYWIVSILVAWLGFTWFQRTRKGFADVI